MKPEYYKQQSPNEPVKLSSIVPYLQSFNEAFGEKEFFCNQFTTGSSNFYCSFVPGNNILPANASQHHISELINIPLLSQLMDSFYNITKIPYSIDDNKNNVLMGRGWQDICTQFHRVCPRTMEKCLQSDRYISTHLQEGSNYVGYKCLNGLMDYATPIIVEGRYLGAIFFGQFLHKSPDKDFFRQQAQEHGFDETAYLEALSRVPIVPEEQIELVMKFYAQLGQILATIGLERLRQIESADKAIQERENDYQLILESSTDGYWHWDIEADRVHISPQLAALLGYPPQEKVLSFNTLKSFIHPEDLANNMQLFNEHLAAKTLNFENEHRVVTISGAERWLLVRGKVMTRDEQGRPLRIAMTCFDITERKQTETALQLSEDRFYKAFNASPIIMCISTFEEGRIIDVNDSFCKIIGHKREDIIGRTTWDIELWGGGISRSQITDLLANESSVRNKEIQFLNNSGELRLGDYSAERLLIDDVPCILSIVSDITEQRKMETEMLRMDRLNLVGEMAASIGHEVRNPMTSIRGFLQMFRDKYLDDQEFLSIMIAELDRANSIISDFLSLAKNKMVHLQPVRLTSLLKAMLPLLQASAAMQDQEILLELNDVPHLLLDEKEIYQLLFNLAHNGLEAMPPLGILTLSTAIQGNQVILSVRDEGPGINEEVMKKLGTPFFTTKENGTGLGLAVCYGIAARHHAKINVDTGPHGTTFNVCFPMVLKDVVI